MSPAQSSPATSAPSGATSRIAGCPRVTTPFRPTWANLPGVTAYAKVIAVARDRNGVPGTLPTTTAAKGNYAWDPNRMPGTATGNVLFNGHTWPDGSAIGNKMLRSLWVGDRIVLHGRDGVKLCYNVTARVQIRADGAGDRYYRNTGHPQLAIIVCSGRRLGPGHWTHRTYWLASPVG